MRYLTIILVFTLAASSANADCVVLLHGLARAAKSMNKLEVHLEEHGFTVANISYPSRKKKIEELASIAIEDGIKQCGSDYGEVVHFVTHSLGGILVRYYLSDQEISNLGHVVMLAPPNQGSEVVDKLKNVPGYYLLNGPAGLQLGTDPESIPSLLGPVTYPVGVIAGTRTINLILSQFLPNPDDGKVSVARTKVNGMSDFLTYPVSHPFIMKNDEVIEQTVTFIETGAFSEKTP